VQNGTLKSYPGFPHGMPTTEAATINADLLAWLQDETETADQPGVDSVVAV